MLLTDAQYRAYLADGTLPDEGELDADGVAIVSTISMLCENAWWAGWTDWIVDEVYRYLVDPGRELPDHMRVSEAEWRGDLEELRSLTLDRGRWIDEDTDGLLHFIAAP